jgi:hypothetical protein
MYETLNKIHAALERIEARQMLILAALIQKESRVMSDLSAITQAVAAETSVLAGVLTMLTELEAAVAATKPDQASIDALAVQITSNKNAMAAAVLANTPAAIPPPPAAP